MSDIFRLNGASKRDPAVDAWFEGHAGELGTLAKRWFRRMRECGSDVLVLLHDGWPVACVGDAPFGYVAAFKSHVNVGFFQGAALKDPAGLLEGTGKRMRHVKLRPGATPNAVALDALIEAAYEDIRLRARIPG
jgi:hypothetical protein